jgi:hypothetical protein
MYRVFLNKKKRIWKLVKDCPACPLSVGLRLAFVVQLGIKASEAKSLEILSAFLEGCESKMAGLRKQTLAVLSVLCLLVTSSCQLL